MFMGRVAVMLSQLLRIILPWLSIIMHFKYQVQTAIIDSQCVYSSPGFHMRHTHK